MPSKVHTMVKTDTEFIEQLRRQIITFSVIGVLTICGTAVGFYYNTQSSIGMLVESHQKLSARQEIIMDDLHRVEREKIGKNDYVRELGEIKSSIISLGVKIDNMGYKMRQ